ncbi:MAG: HAD family phosphatase [Akkermansiaceae bacterium]|jgi:putative hydrolase of the HAD superfamily|nr:HAD family phosphatase [Akkermansiaceae bacterium]
MTFLFDIGKVLLDLDFATPLARLLPPDCANPLATLTVLLEKRHDLESGAMSADDYIAWALQATRSTATPEEFISAWRAIFTPIEPMWATVGALSAAGHRLILFSNTNSIHCPWVFAEFPQFSLFPEAVLSFEVGAIKPQPAIYQYAIDRHGLDPDRTLYIDDLPENIATGRAFGFRCWLYDLTRHGAFEQWLAEELRTAP